MSDESKIKVKLHVSNASIKGEMPGCLSCKHENVCMYYDSVCEVNLPGAFEISFFCDEYAEKDHPLG